jgi:segregation and condensation protein A
MEGKRVPWWRKALNVALSGIRTGFGLFSRTPKLIDELEPEIIAGNKETREETELTGHSPELISIEVEPEIQIGAAGVSGEDNVAAHESQFEAEPAIEAQAEETSGFETLVDDQAQAPESASESTVEADASLDVEVVSAPAGVSSDRQPAGEEYVAQPESVIEAETEAAQLEQNPASERALEPVPVMEYEAIDSGKVVEAPQVEEFAATEEEDAAPAERSTNELSAEAHHVQEADAVPETTEEAAAAVADPEPAAAPPVAAVQVPAQAEAVLQDPPIEPAIEDGFEQVTEQQVTVENVIVDEVASQPESERYEDETRPAVSPVQDELIEPETQASEGSKEEPIDTAAALGALDLNEKEILEEVVAEPAQPKEARVLESNEMIERNSKQITGEVDQEMSDQDLASQEAAGTGPADRAIEQPMDLNHSNPEPDAPEPGAAQEQTADTAASTPVEEVPVAVEEPAAPAHAANAAHHPSKPFIKLEAKEGEANASPFSVIVSQVYDGPLDLLLDLIRKQDIDIYDIPIARITSQFLSYVNQLKAGDVDVAGEFIYTASLLIHIKSKMLLPRAPSGPDDTAEDPRRELVERLLEHERFKNAAQMLQQKQMLEAATWTNPGVRDFKEDAGAEPEIAADTVDLVRVFREILDRARNRPILNVEEDSVTVGQMIQFLSRRLSMEDKPVALRKLLSHSRSERALIAMFLALLELVRLQAILLRQDIAFSEIFIKKHSNFESVMNESIVHDDWK